MEPEDRYYTSSRLKLHYAAWGDESKPALLLIHGGRDHCRSWDFAAQALTDDYACYALDLRGHGDSEWSSSGDYRTVNHVRDIARLIDVLGRDRVSIIAHSMGGRITLDLAGAFPERVERLVVIEGFGWRVWNDDDAAKQARGYVLQSWDVEKRRPHVYQTIDAAAERMKEANPRLSSEMLLHLTRHALRPVDGGYAWKFDNFVHLRPPPDWTMEQTKATWAHIEAPLLLLWGTLSNFPLKDALSQSLPKARQVTLEGAGHWVQHDRLDEVVRLAREHLAGP